MGSTFEWEKFDQWNGAKRILVLMHKWHSLMLEGFIKLDVK